MFDTTVSNTLAPKLPIVKVKFYLLVTDQANIELFCNCSWCFYISCFVLTKVVPSFSLGLDAANVIPIQITTFGAYESTIEMSILSSSDMEQSIEHMDFECHGLAN